MNLKSIAHQTHGDNSWNFSWYGPSGMVTDFNKETGIYTITFQHAYFVHNSQTLTATIDLYDAN